jgi:predicted DCC family thiol-disulfide oxidoreductase YuxK
MIKKERVIIFDGICIFCNKSIDILIKLDKDKLFKYASLEGEYVKGLDIPKDIDSIIFYVDGKFYYKSTAILKILRSLGGIGVIANICYIVPRVIRDYCYDIIAKYRYSIFGKIDSCRMPKAGEEELFLD